MEEKALAGGRTVGAVRIGDAVHRTAQPWTPAVHAVLRHLESAGFEGAPRVLGHDEQGREMLTFLPGETIGDRLPWPAWILSDDALIQAAQWARRLHDTTETFVPPEGLPWLGGQTWRPGLVVGHHDASPYNAVWQDGRLIGFVDWDTTGPSSRGFELAWMALTWVPMHTRRAIGSTGLPASDDHRRLHLLLDAYGYEDDRTTFGSVIAARARTNATVIRQLAATGDPIYTALLPSAADLDQAAHEAETRPPGFWQRPAA